jgi:hypothetical protein
VTAAVGLSAATALLTTAVVGAPQKPKVPVPVPVPAPAKAAPKAPAPRVAEPQPRELPPRNPANDVRRFETDIRVMGARRAAGAVDFTARVSIDQGDNFEHRPDSGTDQLVLVVEVYGADPTTPIDSWTSGVYTPAPGHYEEDVDVRLPVQPHAAPYRVRAEFRSAYPVRFRAGDRVEWRPIVFSGRGFDFRVDPAE